MSITNFKLVVMTALLSFLNLGSEAFASSKTMSYQGRILKSDGSALQYNNVSFLFQVTNPAGSCVIYQEQVDGYNMANSGGVFDVTIGNGTVQFPTSGTVGALDVFSNSVASYPCSNGAAVPANSGATYSPAVSDGRTLRVSFHDGTGWKLISPDFVISSVPYAGYALSAQKLGTNVADDFIIKTGLPTCATGTFLSWDGAANSGAGAMTCAGVVGASGGTVTNVQSSSAYLSVVNGTSAPTLTINIGQVANTVAAGNDTRIVNALQSGAAAGGDLSGTLPSPVVAKIQGTAVSAVAPTAGNFLKFSGGNWVGAAIVAGDVTNLTSSLANKLDQSQFPASCLANQTLTFMSPAGAFTCSSISVNGSQVSGNIAGNAAGFTGALVGDVTGTQGATKVVALQNRNVAVTAPTNGQVLQWNNGASQWEPATPATSGGTITALTGDVTASGSGSVAGTVAFVGTSSAANVHAAELLANAATNLNTASAIVKRDGSGNFSAGSVSQSSAVLRDSGSNTVTLQAPAAVGSSYVLKLPTNVASIAGQVLASDTSGNLSWSTPVGGTVTSVGLTLPAEFTVTNSPISSTGNLTGAWASQAQKTFFAAPNAGSGTPSFRTIASSDLPTVAIAQGGTGAVTNAAARTNLGLGTSAVVDTGSSAGSVPLLGVGGLTADKMCTADGTGSGIICTSSLPLGSQWATSGSDISFVGGRVGVGTTSPVVPFTVQNSLVASSMSPSYSPTQVLINDTPTQTVGVQASNYVINLPNPGANSTATNIASYSHVFVPSSSSLVYKNQYANFASSNFAGSGSIVNSVGVWGQGGSSGTGTVTNAWGLYGSATNSSTGTITGAMGVRAQVQNLGAIGTAYGLYSNVSNSGVITTAYGLYLEKTDTGTITNNYGVYQSDAAVNYFGGNVGIKIAAPSAPAAVLDVAGEVKMGNTSVACSATNEGAQRYNSSTKAMEFCNGVVWDVIGGGGAPTGTVQAFAGAAAPSGYLLCDGSAVSRTTYANLFAVIGTSYGAGDGSTTFNLPDLQGRVAMGAGAGAGLTARTLASVGGDEKTGAVTLSSQFVVSNDVGQTATATPGNFFGAGKSSATAVPYPYRGNSGTGVTNVSGLSVNQVDAGSAGNMQPYTVLNYIIRY